MKYRILLCMCFCSAVLAAQQPGQRFPNRPRIFPRMNQNQQPPEHQQQPQQPPNLDTDGDGVVSREEILFAVRAHLNNERENNQPVFRKILKRFDADNDGEISDDEAMEMHYDLERRMQEGRRDRPGRDRPRDMERPQPGVEPQDAGMHHEEPLRLNDNGLLKGIKIEGLNVSSDL